MFLTRCNSKKIKLILFVCLTVLMVYYLYNTNNFFRNVKENLKLIIPLGENNFNSSGEITADTKFILYWIAFWDIKDYGMGTGFEPFKTCDYKNCYATDNIHLMPLENFDVLLFHGIQDKKHTKDPMVRKPNQIYVYMNVEAPIYITPNLKPFASYFNWTMSYRFDSDVVRRHGTILTNETGYVDRSESLKSKTKLAAWFVSHCKTSSKREVLVQEIQKYMPVDIYGSCGKLKCSHHKTRKKLSSETCYDMVEQNYKFYFAFENSYCKDYSTEKLYNILKRNIVPVVYGAGDYSLSAPPYSVINVENYKNVSHLVDYLKYLDEHDDKYLEYFEWKNHFYISSSHESSACQICNKLNKPLKKKVYDDLFTWWWGKKKSFCRQGKLLPKIVTGLLKK